MTPRERADDIERKLPHHLRFVAPINRNAFLDALEIGITEHVRALLAETPETMELLTYGPLDEEDARWTLAALRRKALGE